MLRIIINLEPGGDASRSRTLSEVVAVNITGDAGRVTNDYAWRIRSVDHNRRETVFYGCLVDNIQGSPIALLHDILVDWKTASGVIRDHHGRPVQPIEDYPAFWKDADRTPTEL